MQKHRNALTVVVTMVGVSFSASAATPKKEKAARPLGEITGEVLTVLWQQPAQISTENLFYGPGGKRHEPRGPFTFVQQDLKGSNPKFDVEDADGVKWKVKLGDEARPETAAYRVVSAVGYYTEWDYYLPTMRVEEMPAELQRGQRFIGPYGVVHGARLKREPAGEKKTGDWKWRHNPFRGTREMNGLRVLMAVINNWDLKDQNNAVSEEKLGGGGEEKIYGLSDLGASFGRDHLTRDRTKTKGDLAAYIGSRFIKKVTPQYVNFATPGRPTLLAIGNPHEFFVRLRLEWIGKRIPRQDARWMGHLLAQLSPAQIRDAFRAAGYSPQEVDGFTTVLEARIAQLERL
jgi:hypothetical protein